jgi:hypothetical protein
VNFTFASINLSIVGIRSTLEVLLWKLSRGRGIHTQRRFMWRKRRSRVIRCTSRIHSPRS